MKIALLALFVTGGLGFAAWQPADRSTKKPHTAGAATYRDRFAQTQTNLTATGASSCASSMCHGGATPRLGEVFLGIEYDLWYDRGQGTHFRAYKVLYEDERSDRMAKLLFGPNAVAKDQAACRTCHAFDVEPRRHGRAFDIEDGVSCEACHGRSEKWNGPHQNPRVWRKELTDDQRTEQGFYDTRNLVRRAEQCLACHLGVGDKSFGHRILAAGHPPLTFELAGDLFNVPKHWRDEQSYIRPDEGSWFHVRVWAVGQAVTLREEMRKLASWAASDADVDYAVFECYACHHDLKVTSWRQRREEVGKLGEPVWNAATWAMCGVLLDLLTSEQRDEIRKQVDRIGRSLNIRSADRATVRSAAESVASLASVLAERASQTTFDRAATFRMIRSLTRDRERIPQLGYRAGVQTFSALYALYRLGIAESGSVPDNHTAILGVLGNLRDLLYDAQRNERAGDYDALALADILAELERLLAGA